MSNYERVSDNKFVKKENQDRGLCEGYIVHIPNEATETDIAEAKEIVVENICRMIRELARREDFFIINKAFLEDGITVGAKFILPTVKSI
jgi:hypothetical protein